MLADLNTWIEGNTSLVVAVGIPLLSAILASATSYIVTRSAAASQQEQRALAKKLKLIDFHRDGIEQLRKEIEEFVVLSTVSLEKPEDLELFAKMMAKRFIILSRLKAGTEAHQEMQDVLQACCAHAGDGEHGAALADLANLTQKLMRGEWDRMMHDFDGTD